MKSPIERVARALCSADGHPENIKFEGKPMWQSYLPNARKAIEALRVPSEAMKNAVAEYPIDFRLDRNSSVEMRNDEMWQQGYADADYLWSTMIDAALREN